jgi:hypothetical protein
MAAFVRADMSGAEMARQTGSGCGPLVFRGHDVMDSIDGDRQATNTPECVVEVRA